MVFLHIFMYFMRFFAHIRIFQFLLLQVLRLLAKSCQDLFHAFEQEDTLKKAMVRNLWTVHRPNVDLERFEKVTDQTWAKDLALGTHRLRQSWVDKRFDNVDEEGFPKPLREDEEVPEEDLDDTNGD